MTNEDIAKRLREVADGSEIRADDEALKLIAIQSDGGMRDALSLLDQCGVMADTVTAETVRNVLGIVGREALRELVRAIGRQDLSAALQLLNRLAEQGKDVRQILTELAEYLRAVLLYKASPGYHEIYLTDTEEAISELAPLFGSDRLMAAEERLHQAMGELRFSARGRITAELCLFDLCRIEGSTIAALMARVEQLEHQVRSGVPLGAANSRTQIKPEPEEKQAATVAAPAASRVKKAPAVSAVQAPAAEPEPAAAAKAETEPKPVSEEAAAATTLEYSGDWTEGEDLWNQALEILKNEKKQSMVACAAGGYVTGYENGVLTVGFKNKFMCVRMNDPDYKKAFEEVLLRLARQSVRLECITAAKPAAAKPKAAPKQPPAEDVEPAVKAALDAFGGTLQKL